MIRRNWKKVNSYWIFLCSQYFFNQFQWDDFKNSNFFVQRLRIHIQTKKNMNIRIINSTKTVLQRTHLKYIFLWTLHTFTQPNKLVRQHVFSLFIACIGRQVSEREQTNVFDVWLQTKRNKKRRPLMYRWTEHTRRNETEKIHLINFFGWCVRVFCCIHRKCEWDEHCFTLIQKSSNHNIHFSRWSYCYTF